MIDLILYRTEMGVEPYSEYFRGIADPVAKSAVAKALKKMERGLLGEVRSLGDGLKESKIDVGAGHRVYFYNDGQQIVVLLSGSDKRSQDREIERAREYLKDYKRQKKQKKTNLGGA